MAAENIGELVPTKIPGYADAADIQAALRLYHYGSYTFDINEDDPAQLVNPSIAYTLNSMQTEIDAIDLDDTVQKTDFNQKGDLITASAPDTPGIISVGANGSVLTANSATESGLEWAAPSVTPTNSVTLTNKTLSSPVINTGFNQQTGTSYTIGLSDNGKILEVSNSSAINVLIPTNSTAFPIGAQITVLQTGTGQITFAAVTSGTTTLNGTPGLKLRAQWSSAVLVKRDTEQWVVLGDLVA